MQLILEATYSGGVFVPDRSLGPENEGKKFKLIVVEEQELEPRRDRFFQFTKDHRFNLPEDYRFSRDDIYDR
jgi:hypothetical protein